MQKASSSVRQALLKSAGEPSVPARKPRADSSEKLPPYNGETPEQSLASNGQDLSAAGDPIETLPGTQPTHGQPLSHLCMLKRHLCNIIWQASGSIQCLAIVTFHFKLCCLNCILPCTGYNVPDWADWEDDPGAYEPDPHKADGGQTRTKPWFPYNPADANPEDAFSDHEAEVDISDIHIPGEPAVYHQYRHHCLLVKQSSVRLTRLDCWHHGM